MAEINWGVIACLLVALTALRGRLLLGVLVLLAPIARAGIEGGPGTGISGWSDLLALPGRVGPFGLFLLVILALLPRSSARKRKTVPAT